MGTPKENVYLKSQAEFWSIWSGVKNNPRGWEKKGSFFEQNGAISATGEFKNFKIIVQLIQEKGFIRYFKSMQSMWLILWYWIQLCNNKNTYIYTMQWAGLLVCCVCISNIITIHNGSEKLCKPMMIRSVFFFSRTLAFGIQLIF